MLDLAGVFAANCCWIALKATQQRNVMGAHYTLMAATAYVLGFFEVFVVYKIAEAGPTLPMVLAIGTSAALGSVTATWVHKRYVGSDDERG